MISTFFAFILALVVAPAVQLFLAWVFVELLFGTARWIWRRIVQRTARRWQAFVASVRNFRIHITI